jgi:hypothetical protein
VRGVRWPAVAMKAFLSFLAVALTQCCQGTTNLSTIAWSEWSVPTESTAQGLGGTLRARLLIQEGHLPGEERKQRETLVFLELQNVGLRDLEIYCNLEKGLQCDLRDSDNKPPPPVGTAGNGGYPGPCWIALPRDATIRVRASWYGFGMPKEKGLLIPLFHPLILEATNTKDYWLSGTFVVAPPKDRVGAVDWSVWSGTLSLPRFKISAKRP